MITPSPSSSPPSAGRQQKQPPVVVIAGAGPCGLVAALALRQYGVPFVIVERASRPKICSNAGSGFELAPTSVEILRNRLGVDVSAIMSYYRGMGMMTMEGGRVRHSPLPDDYDGGSVNRAAMQNHLLELLFPAAKDEEGILLCGSGIAYYEEKDEGEKRTVVVTLESGEKVVGSVLLACDGIHSRCRAVLHGGYDGSQGPEKNAERLAKKDPLHFCKTVAYWGKTAAPEGSKLHTEFFKLAERNEAFTDRSRSFFLITLATKKAPAAVFVIPSQNGTMLNWAISIRSKKPTSSHSNDNATDLTRRGGGPLTEDEKRRLFRFDDVGGRGGRGDNSASVFRGIRDFPLMQELIKQTPAQDITEAGLFDRQKLNLPYTSESKLVALLGDAAHPQTPYLGQGVNMAICDAYVYATNIALATNNAKHQISLRDAIARSDVAFRRKTAKSVIKEARMACLAMTSRNFFVSNLLKLYARYASTEEFMSQIVRTDKSNREYLKHLDENHCSANEQEGLRRQAAEVAG